MHESRRDFLKRAGYTALGAGCALPLLGAAGRVMESGHGGGAATDSQLGMVIDLQKCLDTPGLMEACSKACHDAHNVPRIPDEDEKIDWLWTETYENAFPEQAHAFTADSLKGRQVPVLCNHCSNPACVRVCPTKATWKRQSDGIVMMDMHRCIGCRYCMAACPYGARSFNWRDPRPYVEKDENGNFPSNFPTRGMGVVEKCNFCAERLREGKQPACVEKALELNQGEGGAALVFGDLSDPGSEASKLLKEKYTICRRFGLGTGPNVYYIV
jgi:molybdopterin-containing oxidoreductase family iron-sulfur binding subunit